MKRSIATRPITGVVATLFAVVTLFGCQDPTPLQEEPSTPVEEPTKDAPQESPQADPEKEPAAEPEEDTTPQEGPDLTANGDTPPPAETLPVVERPDENGPPDTTPTDMPPTEPQIDLGPPLVDKAENLKRLDPVQPIWIDTENRRIVMIGQVCQKDAPLEMFACLANTKEHEAVVSVDVKAFMAHAGLLSLGADAGGPVRFHPVYAPASGTEIEVTVAWKDEQGNRKTARAQDWILDTQTQQAMTHPWVFAGSGFWEDEETGQRHYQAEGGDFICVSNFSTAMLDLPIESSQANSGLMFQAFTERIPPLGTPVTLILTPKIEEVQR